MKHRASAAAAVLAALGVAGSALPGKAGSDAAFYPDGYRDWFHVKSMVIQDGHPLAGSFEGIHHVYANPEAREGLRGNGYGEGAVLVFDLLQAEADGNALVEGDRKILAVMVRDEQRFAATGGWGYQAFKGGRAAAPVVSDGGAGCHECHTKVADRDFVYSRIRD